MADSNLGEVLAIDRRVYDTGVVALNEYLNTSLFTSDTTQPLCIRRVGDIVYVWGRIKSANTFEISNTINILTKQLPTEFHSITSVEIAGEFVQNGNTGIFVFSDGNIGVRKQGLTVSSNSTLTICGSYVAKDLDLVEINYGMNINLLNYFYPVDSYYETKNANFDPNVTWGGTWELITRDVVTVTTDDTAMTYPTVYRWHRTT